jgi:2-dehydro-3-deoxyphosphogluconate aldolase/(4S)-4-hydroxy-2-oxoglutarate aldolase
MTGVLNMLDITSNLKKNRIVPVVKLNSADDAVPLCQALAEGGLNVAEITFRTDQAEESIRRTAKAMPDILLGAGTVVTVDQVKRAVAAGASFIVSPGFGRNVVEYCVKNDIPVIPGVCTPTELMNIMEYGLKIAKFFPAEQYGGLPTIKALSAPFGDMLFMPTGGISATNVMQYLAFDKVIACGGSWMVKNDLIKAGRFDEIVILVKQAVALVSA